ncbi:hypothetical protein [Amycolatopsis japonica]|uniref:hypothetical protein n=1 Tax=Amycolatopsis japonica TaxID=208439 RepID=UPI000A86F994|nr:hypothetical protein [Amycolatopsis japonica]
MFVAGSAALLLWCLAFFLLQNTGNTGLAMLALAGMGLVGPMIATAVLNATGSTTGIIWYLAAVCGVSMISAMTLFRLVPSGAAESTMDGPRDENHTLQRSSRTTR